MYPRLLKRPLEVGQSFFLFGPRGTGKTTWLATKCPEALRFDLLDGGLYAMLNARPQRLAEMIPPRYSEWVIIDEVQRVPQLLNEVHRLMHEGGHRFILTGSSARSLRRGGVNLLAGRAHTYHMYPLVAAELGKDFHLESSLETGHLPSVFVQADAPAYLGSYVQTYLREEVLQEGLTRNLAAFSRFLETASFSQAATLNVSEVAREAGVERKTIANYFDLLEDLLLAFRLPVFTRRAKRRMAVQQKFYFFDIGVYRRLRPAGPLDSPQEIEGAAAESLVVQEARALNEYHQLGYSLYYWRTGVGHEVDLVAYGPRGLIAIEVKRSARLSRSDLTALDLFKKDYPGAQCFLFYGGRQREYREGIEIWPLEEAIRQLPNILAGRRQDGPRPS